MPKKNVQIKRYYIPKDYYAPCMYAFEVFCITKSLYKGVETAYVKFSKIPNTEINKRTLRNHLLNWIKSS